MTELELFRVRVALIQAFLQENGHDGVLLSRVDNFAVATGGKRNYVYACGDLGANALFVTRDGASYFIGNNIEATRQRAEEIGSLGCQFIEFKWFEETPAGAASKRFGGSLVSDDGALGPNVNGKLAYLRALLTPAELEKYRVLGRLAADAMMATLGQVTRGMAEADIAAVLAAEGAKRRCLTPVVLVAADERIVRFRHPLPTQAPLTGGGLAERAVEGYVTVVGSFLREGLVASITRFKRVGDVPPATEDAHARICGVDALLQESCRPGKTLGDVFSVCRQAYADFGFSPDEWHNHHQGGTTGYAGRTCKAAPGETFPICDGRWARRVRELSGLDVAFGHAFAWNPSAPGVKSEDTFILRPDGAQEIVTRTPSLPDVDLERVLGRPTEVVKSGMGSDFA